MNSVIMGEMSLGLVLYSRAHEKMMWLRVEGESWEKKSSRRPFLLLVLGVVWVVVVRVLVLLLLFIAVVVDGGIDKAKCSCC